MLSSVGKFGFRFSRKFAAVVHPEPVRPVSPINTNLLLSMNKLDIIWLFFSIISEVLIRCCRGGFVFYECLGSVVNCS